MTDENDARARLLTHYMLKLVASKNELSAFAAGLDRTADPKLRVTLKTKLSLCTNEISDLEEKISKLRETMSVG